MDFFTKQVNMFNSAVLRRKAKINEKGIEHYLARAIVGGISKEGLKAELLGNTDSFKELCLAISRMIITGNVSCEMYTSVVICIAEYVGVQPDGFYIGFCLPRNFVNYNSEIAKFNEKKNKGEEHPGMANHCYVVINDINYDCFNGDFDVEHIDVVRMS